jgi:hypothetical protein
MRCRDHIPVSKSNRGNKKTIIESGRPVAAAKRPSDAAQKKCDALRRKKTNRASSLSRESVASEALLPMGGTKTEFRPNTE